MTFDFEHCAMLPFMQPYLPDNIPGLTPWDPRGFWLPFTSPSQIDAAHSLNYVACSIGNGQYSSTVCPTRSQGGTILVETFANQSRFSYVATGSATPHLAVPGVDPVSTGIVLSTNGTPGSVSGAEWSLGTVPASFSYATQFNTLTVGSNPLDALHILLQNNVGVTLQTRFYNGICEVWGNGGFNYLATIGGLGSDSEAWLECADNGNGTHTVKLYGGCQLYGTPYTGVLATGVLDTPGVPGSGNNKLVAVQQSGANANRVSIIDVLDVGPTQLPDNMLVCTPAFSTAVSPTNGQISLYYEDVSRDVSNMNLTVFITKEGIGSWVQVPLIDVGVTVAKGELDVTADVHRVIGEVNFPAGSGTSMRAYFASSNGAFPVGQGITMLWS